MIDVDGKFTYSSIINLKNDAVAIKVGSIYPNPFAERINISVSLQKAETINVQLINADGRVIKKQTVKGIPGKNNMLMDDLKKLAPGTYFIRVTGSHSILNSSTAVKIP